MFLHHKESFQIVFDQIWRLRNFSASKGGVKGPKIENFRSLQILMKTCQNDSSQPKNTYFNNWEQILLTFYIILLIKIEKIVKNTLFSMQFLSVKTLFSHFFSQHVVILVHENGYYDLCLPIKFKGSRSCTVPLRKFQFF